MNILNIAFYRHFVPIPQKIVTVGLSHWFGPQNSPDPVSAVDINQQWSDLATEGAELNISFPVIMEIGLLEHLR